MTTMQDLGVIAPLWITAAAAALILLLTVAGGTKQPSPKVGTHLIVVAMLGLLFSGWYLLQYESAHELFSGALVVDAVSVIFGTTALIGAALTVLLAAPYLREHELSHGEFLALVLLSVGGMLVLIMAGDLMTLFIGIETMSLGVYVLAGYRRAQKRTQEAALKYFLYGAFASAFALFGIALLYGEVGRATGTPGVAFKAIAAALRAAPVTALGLIGITMVLGGLAFKVAAVPFHMWAPDVYEGAPTPSTGFMAVGVKTAAFAGLCRFVGATFLARQQPTETSIQIFEILAILSMVVGNFLAVRQTQIKRMLAYSSIAHAGYLFVGLAAFVADPKGNAISAIGYYLLGYTVMTLGAFGVLVAFEHRDERRLDMTIERLSGLAHRYPALGLAMAVFMFSLAGIPPTAGFFGKLGIFSAAVAGQRISVVIIGVLASAVGAYYYLRILVVMYMRPSVGGELRIYSRWLAGGLWVCSGLTLVLGIMPQRYLAYAQTLLQGWLH